MQLTRYEKAEADAHKYHALREILKEFGCTTDDDVVHVPTMVRQFLNEITTQHSLLEGDTMAKKREALASLLRRKREEVGWSQAMTADRAGVPLPTYRKWEQGVCSPGAAEFLRACRELGIDCGELEEVGL